LEIDLNSNSPGRKKNIEIDVKVLLFYNIDYFHLIDEPLVGFLEMKTTF
jgi:hypothetical protein